MKKLYEMHVDPEDLGRVLVIMAKSYGVTILHAEEDVKIRRKYFRVYYECTPDIRKQLEVRFDNAGLRWKVVWNPREEEEWM